MSEQIPAEFAWIKPEVKAQYIKGGVFEVNCYPYLKWDRWFVTMNDVDGEFNCEFLNEPQDKITLTITRKQAEALLAGNCPSDVYDQLKEQLK